jgi:hypothetical protein
MDEKKIDWAKFGKNVYYNGMFSALKGAADDSGNKIFQLLIEGLDVIDDKIVAPPAAEVKAE